MSYVQNTPRTAAKLLTILLVSACGSSEAKEVSLTSDAARKAQGCDQARTAVPYRATATGAKPLDALPGAADEPFPCLSLTGHGANEPALGIAHDGTVFFSPATTPDGNGIAYSEDMGATWTVSIPKFPDGGGHPRLQPFFYLDPDTDRMFFASSKLVLNGIANFSDDPGIHLSMSSDRGKTWSYQSLAEEGRDWQKIFGGPPVSSDTGSYPNVLYFSVPSPIAGNWGGIYEPPDFQHFYKSLDGGETWQEASQIPIDPKKLEGCTEGDYAMFGQGSVDASGKIYLGYRLCQQLAVLVSEDEGTSWSTHLIPGAVLPPYDTSSLTGILSIIGGENAITGEPITVDKDGNIYAVWAGPNNNLYYATSRDGGIAWTEPVWVMAPGVETARMVAITAKEPGTVAIAYFGSPDGQRFHGYIAESVDALAEEPTFWTVVANDPAQPLYPDQWQSGYDLSYFNNGGDEITLIQVKYAPDGDIWASFVKDMCPLGMLSKCQWDYAAKANSRFQGAVGRLVHRP